MDTNQNNQLQLKPIYELLGYSFFIPPYQRGYRWTGIQVRQLLDDIWEFAKRKKDDNEFYCLQPVVVKQNDDRWEVVDGQQRLMTIRIILRYLVNNHLKRTLQEAYKKPEYSISFATRTDIEKFLEDIRENEENIDFFHIWKAFETIKKWFNDKDYNEHNEFLSVLLAKEDIKSPVKVIWYELNSDTDPYDVFTRLNVGKIPLTNAELIKALFLQKGNFAKENATLKQIQIASEWDMIEKTLQDDAFWFFIYNLKSSDSLKYDNRIEYIFDLMKEKTKDSEYYYTFNAFYKDFSKNLKNNNPDIDKIWLEIKKYFLTFEEWYIDYKLFHYVGYLVDCKIPINTLKKAASDKKKSEFKEYLKNEIRKEVKCDIDTIEFGDKRIKKILLLFNIQTILETQKSDMRFPFHKYKSENWDIEHVSSQTGKSIRDNRNDQLAWIDDILEYFVGSIEVLKVESFIEKLDQHDRKKEICTLLIELKKEKKIKKDKVEIPFRLVQEYFSEDNQLEDKDSISNLALLDATTNRSYGNAFFPIKRKRIIKNDKKGIFVPIATKNLFLKYYSNKSDQLMYWSSDDAKDYLQAIKLILEKDFLPKEDSNG